MSGLIDPTQPPAPTGHSTSMIEATASGLETIVRVLKKEARQGLSVEEMEQYINHLRGVSELLKGGGDVTLDMIDRLRRSNE